MANRTGTYIAFDGLGQTDPTKSDFRYYGTIQAWDASKSITFNFVNSHDKTDAVRDTSKQATLKDRIQERLRASKNIIVILSSDTRKSGSMLTYEIEQAVDTYKLPLIITYVDYKIIASVDQLSSYWPNALSSRIGNSVVRAIHIPFIKEAILDAVKQFNVSNLPATAKNFYSEQGHRIFGVLSSSDTFTNTRK